MNADYRHTLFLPETPLPMKAGLPQKEADILARWRSHDLYTALSQKNQGARSFVLHDGPPYANGPIHLGHAMGKILKDFLNRYHRMMGRRVSFRPGWDCHGLPIEWKIEEHYQAQKKRKADVSLRDFRQECRAYAQQWSDHQSGEFQRLGIDGLWDHPYLTMDFDNEAAIVRAFGKLWENNLITQGVRPVWWSTVEQTALAEAEIEYHEKTSTEAYVSFPVLEGDLPPETSLVAWTTTPWTLPANAGLAVHPDLLYALLRHPDGRHFVVLRQRAQAFSSACGIPFDVIQDIPGHSLIGTLCQRPFPLDADKGPSWYSCVYPATFITDDQGTGIVHIAPAHGEDDFLLMRSPLSEDPRLQHRLDTVAFFQDHFPQIVTREGLYTQNVPHFGGQHIFKVTPAILEHLKTNHRLLGERPFVHSYPHSWRSKAPLITLLTPQWFVTMDGPMESGLSLREVALRSLHRVGFFPSKSRARLTSMVASRPDWCLSRQRLWGVPLTIVQHKETGEVPQNPQIIQTFIHRVASAIAEKGCDAWFETPLEVFFEGLPLNPNDYEKSHDILDVWFDSGTTFSFALDPDQVPADLYLEGSDQHRGWFQSSLLVGSALLGQAPYKNLMTHGFVLDHQGRKMSKSLGNVVAPQDIVKNYGADILRLWAIFSDTSHDVHVQKTLFDHYADIYRRFRNTMRFLHGNLHGWCDSEMIEYGAMPPLEQWILHHLKALDHDWQGLQNTLDFSEFYQKLHTFCSSMLSSFYFDIRKDTLYCESAHSPKRWAARTVLRHVYDALLRWLAPLLCFTAEELYLLDHENGSVHLLDTPPLPAAWGNASLAEHGEALLKLRACVLQSLEQARKKGDIKANLEADVTLELSPDDRKIADHFDFTDIALVSRIHYIESEMIAAPLVSISKSSKEKCLRCWRHDDLTPADHSTPHLCDRCASVIQGAS